MHASLFSWIPEESGPVSCEDMAVWEDRRDVYDRLVTRLEDSRAGDWFNHQRLQRRPRWLRRVFRGPVQQWVLDRITRWKAKKIACLLMIIIACVEVWCLTFDYARCFSHAILQSSEAALICIVNWTKFSNSVGQIKFLLETYCMEKLQFLRFIIPTSHFKGSLHFFIHSSWTVVDRLVEYLIFQEDCSKIVPI